MNSLAFLGGILMEKIVILNKSTFELSEDDKKQLWLFFK